MALNLFFSSVTILLCVFLTSASARISGCNRKECFEFDKDHTEDHVWDTNDSDTVGDGNYWRIYCFKGVSQSIISLWVNPVMKIKFNSSHPRSLFMAVRGGTVEEVKEQQGSYNPINNIVQWLRLVVQRDMEEIKFAPFNQSCIGIDSNVPFRADFLIKNLEPWLLASLGFGIILFLSAGSWSHNVKLHYGFGVGVGVIASVLVLVFVMSRMFPQSLKKVGYILMALGSSFYMWIWTYIAQHIHSSNIFMEYWQWIVGYVGIAALISFAVCYRYGPVTEPRTLYLIKWGLQLIALVFIYNGTQIREASVAIIVTLITLYNLPAEIFNNRLTRYIRYRIFKPKIRLLTEEEYQEQGHEETKKALEELRSFCQSPDCNAWKTISRLKSPGRFADFVEGKSWHVTDDELLEYDSGPDVTPVMDDDSDQETQNVRNIQNHENTENLQNHENTVNLQNNENTGNLQNHRPDSSQGNIPEISSEEESQGETSDQSIDGPPLS